MPRLFNEDQARSMLDMSSVIKALEIMFRQQGAGQIDNIPRTRTKVFEKSLNITAASDAMTMRYAVKLYGGGGFHILLYSRDEGLLAIMEADWLGQLRTGGTNALAASLMAAPKARKVGLIGAGRQAVAQLLALEAMHLMDEVRVFARNRERLEAFCNLMTSMLKAKIRIATCPEEAVADAEIVVVATNSSTPVLRLEWLPEGVHVNAMGANAAARMELEPEIIAAASIIATDDVDQARKEAAEFIALGDRLDWSRITPLHRLVCAKEARARDPVAPTVFKSLGAGLEDLAIASLLYDRSLK